VIKNESMITLLSSAVFCAVMMCAGFPVIAQITTPSANMTLTMEEFAEGREMMGTYVVNPLDRLMLVIYAGDRQIESFEEFVKSDGTVYLPFLEQDVKIGGLRILEAEEVLERLSRTSIKEPRIVITVLSSYSQTVSTYGRIVSMDVDIMNPMRVLQLIAKAGGPLPDARADSIRVISLDGEIKYFDFDKVNKNPTGDDNFFLKPGDIVFVPGINDFSVTVLGDVRTPGTYGMKSGGKLIDALVKSGSWSPSGDISNISIVRVSAGGQVQVLEINLEEYLEDGNAVMNYALMDGDVVHVPGKKGSILMAQINAIMSILYTVVTTYTVVTALRK